MPVNYENRSKPENQKKEMKVPKIDMALKKNQDNDRVYS